MTTSACERVELGRYTMRAGERVIYGQRVLGVVRVVDVPAVGRGRRYVIERGLTSMGRAGGDRRRLPAAGRRVGRGPSRARVLARDRRGAAMSPHQTGLAPEFTERDLLIATLVGRYVERRERGDVRCAHDLLAVAAEHGDGAVCELRDVLAFFEAMRATDMAG
jgi:hypothetical protein